MSRSLLVLEELQRTGYARDAAVFPGSELPTRPVLWVLCSQEQSSVTHHRYRGASKGMAACGVKRCCW